MANRPISMVKIKTLVNYDQIGKAS